MAFNLQTSQMVNIIQDLRKDVAKLSEHKNLPLFSKLGMLENGMAATHTKHEWPDYIAPSKTTTLNTTINDSTTSVVVKNDNANGIECVWRVGQIFRIYASSGSGVFEEFKVTAVSKGASTTTLTVDTRPFRGTAAAATAGVTIHQKAVHVAEGSEPTYSNALLSVNRYNYTQIYRDSFKLSSTAQSVNDAARDGKMEEQQSRVLERLMKDLHRQAISGIRYKENNGDGDEVREMGGLDFFIHLADGDSNGVAPVNNSNVLDQSGAQVGTSMIDDVVKQINDMGGACDTLFMSPTQKNLFDLIKDTRVKSGGMSQGERSISNLVDVYESNIGELKVVVSNDVPDNVIYMFNSPDLRVVPLQGNSFQVVPLDKTSALNDKADIVGEYTMVGHLMEQMFKLTNLATTAS